MSVRKRFARRTLVAASTAVALLAITALVEMPTRLVWNASASVPIGLYVTRPAVRMTLDELALVRPPQPLAAFLADRGYVGAGVPLLKRIAAVPGQTVCRQGLQLAVDGVTTAAASERDRAGRPLPRWSGCHTLTASEVLLLNADAPGSMDGRYFGTLPASSIVGRVTPLWTHEE